MMLRIALHLDLKDDEKRADFVLSLLDSNLLCLCGRVPRTDVVIGRRKPSASAPALNVWLH